MAIVALLAGMVIIGFFTGLVHAISAVINGEPDAWIGLVAMLYLIIAIPLAAYWIVEY